MIGKEGSNEDPLSIAKFAVHRRVAVSMIALAIVVLGIFAVPRLPIALLPAFTQPVVTVSITYPNVGPQQMETLIARPIENAVSRVNGIQQINSTSSEGNTSVTAQFFFGTNIDTAAVDVQEQVSRIYGSLPNDPNLQQPVITKFDSNSLPVVRVFITDPNMSLRDLGDLFTNVLADEFSAIDGVAAVTISNDQQRAIMVAPDANALAVNGVTLSQIMQRIAQENVNLPAGVVQVGKSEYLVRASALLTSAEQTGDLIVTTKNGAPIRLNQVAKVTDSILEQRTFQRLNGTPAAGMTINAQPDANIVATATGVYAKIADIESRYPGMKIAVVFDQRGFIQDAISALEHTAILGALLAVAVIFLFLHSWRSTIIVAVSLPVSVLGTLFAGYVLGYTLNIMTLGGLALAVGLIVDDAIVVIENIYRHMARGQTPLVAAETATAEIFSAVLASSVTVITVFVPLVLIPGLAGFAVHAVRRDGHGRRRSLARRRGDASPHALVASPQSARACRHHGETNGATNGSTNGVHSNGNGATKRRQPVSSILDGIRPALRALCELVFQDAGACGRPARARRGRRARDSRRDDDHDVLRRGANGVVPRLKLALRTLQPADADRNGRLRHQRNGRRHRKPDDEGSARRESRRAGRPIRAGRRYDHYEPSQPLRYA